MDRAVEVTRFTIGEWVPLLMFGVTYVLTCLLGAVLMLLQYAPFVELYEYFSGTAVPVLAGSELISAVLLLFGCAVTRGSRILGRIAIHSQSTKAGRESGERRVALRPRTSPLLGLRRRRRRIPRPERLPGKRQRVDGLHDLDRGTGIGVWLPVRSSSSSICISSFRLPQHGFS